MNKDQIIYVGGFRLPDQNASAIRVRDIAHLFSRLNYTIHIGGLIVDKIKIDNNLKYWDYSLINGDKIKRDREITPIIAKVEEIGKENLKAIIAYNYAPLAFYNLYQYCKKEDIVLIPDITEWYLIDGKVSLQKILRMWLTNWRIKRISPKCKNAIVAVDAMRKNFSNHNIIALPQVSSIKSGKRNNVNKKNNVIKFTYAGYPGRKFSKENINFVIKAFEKLHDRYQNYEFTIIGIDKETALQNDASLKSAIEKCKNSIRFLGRLPHNETIKFISQGDFSIFIRPDNRVSRYGFPTKVKEAFEMGVPIFTNNTGDLSKYIKNGENGILIQDNKITTISRSLEKVFQYTSEDINRLKTNCAKKNPFYEDEFIEESVQFFNKF
ncbi:glycosyltransferase family 4 protein [Membranihabitans marinus]|uniref:glycosyltransferase family 4 protein n=1 Tax=Membranihabitans marinus TaxID=1227546 RepID=UPI001F3CDD7B|nr:glycosyltransferase family 4 protein [Membranihabitans marinus]